MECIFQNKNCFLNQLFINLQRIIKEISCFYNIFLVVNRTKLKLKRKLDNSNDVPDLYFYL